MKKRHLVLVNVDSLEKVRDAGGVVYPSWMAQGIPLETGEMPALMVTIEAKLEATLHNHRYSFLLENGNKIEVYQEVRNVPNG